MTFGQYFAGAEPNVIVITDWVWKMANDPDWQAFRDDPASYGFVCQELDVAIEGRRWQVCYRPELVSP